MKTIVDRIKRNLILPLTFAIGFGSMAYSQESSKIDQTKVDSTKYWKSGGVITTTFSQVALINWAKGGQSSISSNGLLNLFVNYKKEKIVWDNTLDMAYGITKQGKEGIIKNDDKIYFASKYGIRAFKHWYYSSMLNFNSQFSEGYTYPNDSVKISDFMAPAYILASIGMNYKPSDKFSLLISPFTGKTTIVNDDMLSNTGGFGVEKGKKIRNEFGGFVKIMAKKEIMKNITFQSKLELFSNYLENPQNIDVYWDVLISMKVNKYISANLNTTLIYDDDIDISVDNNKDGIIDSVGPKTQFKENFGVGLSFKF